MEGVAEGDDLFDAWLATELVRETVEMGAGDFIGGQIGGLDNLADCPVGEEAAVGDVGEPMTAFGFVHVMGGDQNGEALGGELMDLLPEIAAGLGIDAGGGFVEEQELGLMDEAGGEGEALFPAAGELTGELLAAFEETEAFEGVAHGFCTVGDRVNAGDEIEVFLDAEVFVEAETLGHVTDLAFDGGGVGTDVVAEATT